MKIAVKGGAGGLKKDTIDNVDSCDHQLVSI